MSGPFFHPMKTIVICRHAKSDWSFDLPDFKRPLNSRGTKDAPRMGKLLKGYGFMPDLILSSSAERAKQTAELVAENMGYDPSRIKYNRSIYDEGTGNVISLLQVLPESVDSVMVFGHNPTQEGVVRFLLDMGGAVTMPTCAMACMELSISSWKNLSPNWVNLKWFLIPRMIK